MTTTSLDATTEALLERLEDAWRHTDRIFATIREVAYTRRGIPLRHPPIFYLGHMPAFAWNQIGRGVLGREPLDARLDALFERGIDPRCDGDAGTDEPGPSPEWPSLEAVRAYRDRAREAVAEAARALPARAGEDELARDATILHVVLEHELMHHETLLYIVHRLDPAGLDPTGWEAARPGPDDAREPPPAREVEIPAGRATLGAEPGSVPFGWDNEFPARRVDVDAFTLDARPVTMGEFAAFVADGGYEDPALWTEAERRWLGARRAPVDWRLDGGAARVRTLFEEVAVGDVAAWPVHVSQIEARAYLRALGKRLPTEAELHRAAHGAPDGSESPYPWGEDEPRAEHGGFDSLCRRPLPVGSRPAGRSAFGVDELVGNGWEWTSTPFSGLPGFAPTVRTYPGYSADFFDDRHAVVFGAAWPTDRALLRRSFRNWYQTHYPYAYTTFRGARG